MSKNPWSINTLTSKAPEFLAGIWIFIAHSICLIEFSNVMPYYKILKLQVNCWYAF